MEPMIKTKDGKTLGEKVCLPEAGQTMIQLKGVFKSFGNNHVLRGVNLEIKCGESMVVIGGSGTGKSVLIKCVIGLLHHDQGEIHVDGKEISHLKEGEWNELRKKFGMLFQRDALFDSLTVWENVGFGLRRHTNLSDEEIKAIAVEKLKLVGMNNVENLMPAELSGGCANASPWPGPLPWNRRFSFTTSPPPASIPIMANVINELIVTMREKLDVTSIAITHDMNSAYRIADRIAMLYKGEIIEVGTPDQIQKSAEPHRAAVHQGEVEGPITRGADFGRQIFQPFRR